MKKLEKYANGEEYVVGGLASISPNGIDPIEEIDLESLTNEEFIELKENLHNKKIKNRLLEKAKEVDLK